MIDKNNEKKNRKFKINKTHAQIINRVFYYLPSFTDRCSMLAIIGVRGKNNNFRKLILVNWNKIYLLKKNSNFK